MKRIVAEQFLPLSLEKAWDFFSSPKNLNEITPPEMTFKILYDIPEKMYEGMMISYKISPMLNIPLDWVTEITHVKDHEFFVDEQRIGPYAIWHHEHHFKALQGGVMMTDILHYHVGLGPLGWIASKLFVDAKVQGIFDYRFKKLEGMFSKN